MALTLLKTPACLLPTARLLSLPPRRPLPRPTTRPSSTNLPNTPPAPDEPPPLAPDKPPPLTPFPVTPEIHLYRHPANPAPPAPPTPFSDPREPYGPPLAIILPWEGFSDPILQKLLHFYAEKGFDALTVSLKNQQFLYPCVAGHAMTVVTDLLKYLSATHKHRPYVFHGFSIGAYIFGEIMAQFSDQYDTYREICNNVKGCLWDSPVDFLTVRPHVGRFLHPRSVWKRWRCNRDVRRHFRKHHHDSVAYWLRSRESFCNPIIKVPNLFLVSYTDPLSNPCSLQYVQKVLECNGIPVFQKTWWDSPHALHYEKYCYEYTYGMILFFNLANLYPDECGKYRSSYAAASLTNLRLSKKARDSYS